MRTVAVVGSTGSIGTQTLDVVRSAPERYQIVALGAKRSVEMLAAQAAEFEPKVVAIADGSLASQLGEQLPPGVELRAGPDALSSVAEAADVVVNAVVGFIGLDVTLAALAAGRRLALANKESLIAGGPVVQAVRATPGAEIIPVDSEHCAVHQCLRASAGLHELRRIILTASGGPFRGRTADELAAVTVEEALRHPTWKMGPKITVDSSTLMNKGLEVIEAHELFRMPYEAIEVVIHPQSIVHSLVEFGDGATIAQLSDPDMRMPIGYALAYPDRMGAPFGAIDWSSLRRLDFERPDTRTFPALGLAYEAGRMGGTAPAALNAANEVAAEAFIDGAIAWLAIPEVIQETLAGWDGAPASDVSSILDADSAARHRARTAVEKRARAA